MGLSAIPIVLAAAGGAAMPALEADPLGPYRWQKRIVVIFGDGEDAKRQSEDFRMVREEADERDMLVFRVTGQVVDLIAGEAGALPSSQALRDRFHYERDGLRVVLVGKDGGTKKVVEQHVPPEDIFATVDSMPMRQQEMQRQ